MCKQTRICVSRQTFTRSMFLSKAHISRLKVFPLEDKELLTPYVFVLIIILHY